MLRRAVHWLTGREGDGPATGSVPPAAAGGDAVPEGVAAPVAKPSVAPLPVSRSVMLTLAAGDVPPGSGNPGANPGFTSRAVRDAKVVSATVDAMRRYVSGHETADVVLNGLRALTPDQVEFLRMSLELDLADQVMTEAGKRRAGPAVDLRRLMGELAARPASVEPPAPRSARVPTALAPAIPAAPATPAVPTPAAYEPVPVPPPFVPVAVPAIEMPPLPATPAPVEELTVLAAPAPAAVFQPIRLKRDEAAKRRAQLLDDITRDYL